MPQLDQFTYFTQFFWSCLFFFTFYILICNDRDGVLGIVRNLMIRRGWGGSWGANSSSTTAPSSSASGSGDDPDKDRWKKPVTSPTYKDYYRGVVKDIQALAEGILGKKVNYQKVRGLVERRVCKVGDDLTPLARFQIELRKLGETHPLVEFVVNELRKKGF